MRFQYPGKILDGPAKARHGVPLEMRKDNVRIIICKCGAYIIFRQHAVALNRQNHEAVLIQNLEIRDLGKAMGFRHLIMHGCPVMDDESGSEDAFAPQAAIKSSRQTDIGTAAWQAPA